MTIGYLLDTNIVSLIMRQDAIIIQNFGLYRAQKQNLLMCGVTYFEIRRGLLVKNAAGQMRKFEAFMKIVPIVTLDDMEIFEQAAAIHADLQRRGLMIQTEDILIAATGIVKGLTVVSRDEDLRRIKGLSLETWLS
ncbi:type II toxin-antitoxin system VapC family toxin [Roseofilum reptotaenium CS-1145]|uniref:type II toxin-antitoxin system VapC family toxin n=1 Tax=Roseofilum reptotaenium TaxID=1233427 RepID=UPI000B24924E|nr:type II toxin-antitoxin system VapC family toxin [Roseofilum reptotaenium]MDB9520245.1 type II toxin-antitoxin system VapC family toxin [Roseofilum reptotaenium CS-1145]